MSETEAKVFIIDDDASVRVSLGRLLRSAGHRCEAFESAESFLRARSPDADGWIIADVHMPGMTGVELMDQVLQSHKSLRIVLITAFDDAEVRLRALEAGVAVLLKPFDDSVLLAVIGAAP